MVISSKDNDRIKAARSVRDGREPGMIFIEGAKLAAEALRSDIKVEAAFITVDARGRDAAAGALLRDPRIKGAPVFEVTEPVIASISDTQAPQGIILLARRPALRPVTPSATLLLGLDRVQDPGNMGTLLRTAEAAGVDAVIPLGGCADVYSPKVLRSAMGAAFRMPLAAAEGGDLTLPPGMKVAAATGEGDMDYCEFDWRVPVLLLLGNEGQGLRPELLARCDARLRIPMARGVESLNVAAAGAVILFEAARQRRQAGQKTAKARKSD
ncbi:MAG TPA: RNA methyltransferase [Prosthecobacter sp.]|nr:RNA methyltransferase [Prosthecobacter sp.]HRK13608.1 RNA methyltransferase [Prosthecobacter sp.]